MPDRVSVPSADFIRNIGHWQNEALRRPISITHHGRERLVLAAPEEFLQGQKTVGDAETLASLTALRTDAGAVLENLEEGFLAFDGQLNVKSANAVAETFIGLAPADFESAAVFDALPQPLSAVLRDRLQRVLRTRKIETFEAGGFDGRHIAARVFPLANGVGVLFRNTTEQHALRSALEDGAALAAALARHSSAAAIKVDGRARIESIDDAFCEASGFNRADVIGHRFIDLVSGAQRREIGELLDRVMRDAAPSQTELTMLGKRGQELPGMLAVAPILTDFIPHGAICLWIRHAAGAIAAA